MKEIKKEDIKQEVFDLYDDYVHNNINRRIFIERLSLYAIGGLTVPSILSFIQPILKKRKTSTLNLCKLYVKTMVCQI